MNRKIYILAASLMAFASCSFLDVPPTVMVGGYTSEEEALYGLAGVYGVINNEAFYGNYYSLMLSNVDDLCYFNRTSASNYSVWYQHDASSPEVYDAWTEIYRGIGNANTFMEAMENSEYDPDHKLYNEAKFLRAYYYFILAQAWGDVPLRTTATTSPSEVECEATSQLEVLKWVVAQMEECLPLAEESLDNAPSRVVKTTMWGILARVYLFMAGESVSGTDAAMKHEYFGKALEYAGYVIISGKHKLNQGTEKHDGYSQIFINMISDEYDTKYHESMWEAEFKGNRSSSDNWSNGRIGDLLGLQCQPDTYDKVNCNFAYGQYSGSLKLWYLYWEEDRTDDEARLGDGLNDQTFNWDGGSYIEDRLQGWDRRQFWNMSPYNYIGGTLKNGNTTVDTWVAGIDKTPYRESSITTEHSPAVAKAVRDCGKFRRETEYEGVKGDRGPYTPVNYPILRYADVLLMYAEAYNEYNGRPSEDVFNDCIIPIRERAGIKTKPYSEYSSQEAFRQLVRNERGRELVFESLRKYDLIRWGIFKESMQQYLRDASSSEWTGNTAAAASTMAASVQSKHIVLPIPAIELGVNKKLRQNPLW